MNLNSDHGRRIVVEAHELLAAGAGERLLETRAVKEQSRIRLLSLRAGESWTHEGVRLLEVLVVRGSVSLDGLELGPSSYARLTPGLPATLRSESGGVLYLNGVPNCRTARAHARCNFLQVQLLKSIQSVPDIFNAPLTEVESVKRYVDNTHGIREPLKRAASFGCWLLWGCASGHSE
mgnify:CR=1 FL=1